MALAQLTDVVKRYDSKLTVDHVNLSINEGKYSACSARTARAKARRSACSAAC